jgi:muramoyltetrapeptide carboxypeptidase
MIAPKPLQPNDLVWLVSPAGVIDSVLVEGAANTLMNWGLKVKTGVSCHAIYGGLPVKQKPAARPSVALDDPECSAIFCTEEAMQHPIGRQTLIGRLGKHPKWLIGFSDIHPAALLLQINGYASIHGGMASVCAR